MKKCLAGTLCSSLQHGHVGNRVPTTLKLWVERPGCSVGAPRCKRAAWCRQTAPRTDVSMPNEGWKCGCCAFLL